VGLSESTNAVARAAVVAARELKCRSILSYTESGQTAALISEYRPEAGILAVTPSRAVYRRLGLHWGVTPLHIDQTPNTDEPIARMLDAAAARDLVDAGETVVIIMGTRSDGASDLLKVHVA